MPKAEVAGWQTDRRVGEYITGPGPGEPGREAHLQAGASVDGERGLDQGRRFFGLGRIVAAGDIYDDVAVAPLGQVSLELALSLSRRLVGHQPQVQLGCRL